ncbi:MAG: glycosyltransferase family 2 protein, partial [Ilumatobacteraceae bacterium]
MQQGTRFTVSVVSPVFNNAGTIKQLVQRIVGTRDSGFPEAALEIILVDDGSSDGSLGEMRDVLSSSAPSTSLKVLRLSRNFGQVSAIVAGLSICSGDAAIVISADLQDPPELMSKMVEGWRNGAEVVIAAREAREDGAVSSLFSRMSYAVARRPYREMPRGGFDYFLLSRRATAQFVAKPGRKRFLQGEIFELGFQRLILNYVREKRKVGKSQWRFWKRFEYFVDLVLASTSSPIRAATFVGFLGVIASIVYAVVVTVARILGAVPIDGWTPLILITLFFGGITVFLLGLIGEYIWRIYDEV